MVNENKYQSELKKRIRARFPGCLIFKNDPVDMPGVPDLAIIYKDKWAMLEVKRTENAEHRPNQDYYVAKFGTWSFTSFIYPENEEEVLNDMARSFEA